MIIDFHTHSHASDGALPPLELIDRAIEAGVKQFAITDHDTMGGYLEVLASAATLPADFQLISGIEMSCVWSNATIHVVGLDVDIEHEVLQSALSTLDTARGNAPLSSQLNSRRQVCPARWRGLWRKRAAAR